MSLSEDRILAIAKKMVEELRAKKMLRPKGMPARLETEIQRVMMQDLKTEDEIDAEVEARIESMKRDIPYGSDEWRAIFTQIKDELSQQRDYIVS